MTVDALAFEALEEDLGQSLAVCPDWPQNMQSFSLKHCWCSSLVSLLSLPRWVGIVGVAEVEDDGVDFFTWELELAELGVEDAEVVDEADLEVDEAEEEDTGLTCLVISDLRSQYWASIVWASMRKLGSMTGLPM